jgi:hypothetical protein
MIYGVGDATTPSVGNVTGLPVGRGNGVIEGVSDAGGAMAVWVSKKFAMTVPTPAVREALMSTVGSPGA